MSKLLVENATYVFGQLEEPTAYADGGVKKYFGKFLVADEATIKKIEAEVKEVAIEKFKTLPRDLADPIFEPDIEKYPDQKGSIVLNAAQLTKPVLRSRSNKVIQFSDGIIYSGAVVNVLISLWAWNYRGAKGVSANLLGIQFVADGEPLGGSTASDEDFITYENSGDDDEQDNPLF